MSDNSDNLKKMLRIYQPNGFDWMNITLTKHNPYTFHHIVPRSIGGKDEISNGAILTRKAHDLLHLLEMACPDAFIDLQNLFIKINESNAPLTQDILDEIDDIMLHIFAQDKYSFDTYTDLKNYYQLFCCKEKQNKRKRLEK